LSSDDEDNFNAMMEKSKKESETNLDYLSNNQSEILNTIAEPLDNDQNNEN